jgi:hypothetical protein
MRPSTGVGAGHPSHPRYLRAVRTRPAQQRLTSAVFFATLLVCVPTADVCLLQNQVLFLEYPVPKPRAGFIQVLSQNQIRGQAARAALPVPSHIDPLWPLVAQCAAPREQGDCFLVLTPS